MESKSVANAVRSLESLAATLIIRVERLCNTAVGWVMCVLAKVVATIVATVLLQYKGWITREASKNATKYLI